MAYDIIRPASHEEWLAERQKGIGSSDAGTIMGISPFSSQLRLWRQRRGIDPPTPESPAMRNGHFLEPAVAEWFADTTRSTIDYSSEGDWLAADRDRPWLRVSPDRLFWPEGVEHTAANWCILEIKSTSKIVDPDDLPYYWVCQVQYQMGIMGITHAAIAWVTSEPRLDFGYAWIRFNPAFFETLTGAIDTFWKKNILGGEQPAAIDGRDASLLWPTSSDNKTVQATTADVDMCLKYTDLKKKKEELETELLRLEDDIKIRFADAEYLQATDPETGEVKTIARYKSINETVFQEEKLHEEEPDKYVKYLVEVFDKKTFKDDNADLFKRYSRKVKGARRFSVNL